jgi:prepilin-type N-terminal cleavage/methylation domain-containing protein
MARRRRPIPRAARQAYTIIELTIVVLILAILAAAAAPRYRSALNFHRINAAAGRVAADLRMIRQHARKSSNAQTVTFSAATDSYSAPNMPGMNDPTTAYAVDLKASEYLTDVVTATFGSLGGGPTVTFDIYGRPDNVGTVILQSDGFQRTVEVDEAGNVRIP